MLTVEPLKGINTLWLGVYVRYTPAKSFEVWLQWDERNQYYIAALAPLQTSSKFNQKFSKITYSR